MSINRVACAAVVMILIAASFLVRTERAAPDGFTFDAAELNDTTLWTQVNAKPYHISTELDGLCRIPTSQDYKSEGERKGNPHVAPSIIVYVNNAGKQAMFAKQPQFPKGSIIIKKKLGTFHEHYQPILYTVMRKRAAGYNPAVGDWEFLVVGTDGKELQASGRLERCQSCHVSKKDSDFVFRPYVTLE